MARKSVKPRLYRIGQVAKMVGLQPFVLRFWEKEFKLKLPKAKSGHRYYRPEDIQKILMIKRLLHTEGFTIKGAMQKLKWGEEGLDGGLQHQFSPREANYRKTLQQIRGDVEHMLERLEK